MNAFYTGRSSVRLVTCINGVGYIWPHEWVRLENISVIYLLGVYSIVAENVFYF